MADSKYKLTYFNLTGLGEGIRFVLAYADQEFEDYRIDRADWPAVKESYPYEKLPILEVDGKVLNQSTAIARFLGKRFGLVSDDPWTDALQESVVDTIKDLTLKLKDEFLLKTPEAKKEAEDAAKFYLSRLEKVCTEGYFYGSKPTWVDVSFAGFHETIESFKGEGFLKDYPNLTALVEKIKSKDSVKKYLAARPPTVIHEH